MKYLYLLGSVLRSRLDKEQRKYTLSAMLMFFFSSFLMLFAASVMGSDILFSNEDEDWANTSYVFYAGNKEYDRETVAASEYVINSLFSLNSNKIDFIDISIYNDSDTTEKIGTTRISNIEFMPVLKENGDERLRFNTWIGRSTLKNYHTPYPSEQNIAEGREITKRELEAGERVIVLPESCGVKSGEKINLFGEEFTVVGTTLDAYARIPSSFLESAAFENTGILYRITQVDFDKQMTNETYKAFNQAVYQSSGKEIGHYKRHALPSDPKIAYKLYMGILGTVIALFSVFGIYYPTLRLCRETMPMLSGLKLCGMRMLPALGLLALSLLACFAVSFGAASAVLILTEDIFSRSLLEYELKNLYFSFSAIIFILVAAFAVAPPIIKMAKTQPSEEVENG